MTNERIENNFTYHAPTQEQAEVFPVIRTAGKDLAYLLDEKCPDSREKALAMTKLEECIMWANAAVARN